MRKEEEVEGVEKGSLSSPLASFGKLRSCICTFT